MSLRSERIGLIGLCIFVLGGIVALFCALDHESRNTHVILCDNMNVCVSHILCIHGDFHVNYIKQTLLDTDNLALPIYEMSYTCR